MCMLFVFSPSREERFDVTLILRCVGFLGFLNVTFLKHPAHVGFVAVLLSKYIAG